MYNTFNQSLNITKAALLKYIIFVNTLKVKFKRHSIKRLLDAGSTLVSLFSRILCSHDGGCE